MNGSAICCGFTRYRLSATRGICGCVSSDMTARISS